MLFILIFLFRARIEVARVLKSKKDCNRLFSQLLITRQKRVNLEYSAETTLGHKEVEVSFKTSFYLLDKTNFESAGGSTDLKKIILLISIMRIGINQEAFSSGGFCDTMWHSLPRKI